MQILEDLKLFSYMSRFMDCILYDRGKKSETNTNYRR